MLARENPFSTENLLNLRFENQSINWGDILETLQVNNNRGCVVGPCGSGKTTFLKQLELHLCGNRDYTTHFIKVDSANELFRVLADLPNNTFLLVDGLEKISWFDRMKFKFISQRYNGVVCSTHKKLMFPVIKQNRTSLSLLYQLIGRLVPDPNLELVVEAEKLFLKYNGDLHQIFLGLYDFYAKQDSILEDQNQVANF